MKVLYCASEVYPYAISGGLGDVAGSLPAAMQTGGVECRVVLPLYGKTPPALRGEMQFLCSFEVPLGWRHQYCGVFTHTLNGVQHYFIDNEYYFKYGELYGHFDDGERFAFFSKAVLEMLKHIDYQPDILHCNDWQSALACVYINTHYRSELKYQKIKTVFTIHNIQYQGSFDLGIAGDVLGFEPGQESVAEYKGAINYMKGAIASADRVTTVSPSYAIELQDAWYSHGLSPVICENAGKLHGILNGIDTNVYNPGVDKNIAANYTPENVTAGKAVAKQLLQKEFGLQEDKEKFVIGMVTRLVEHKGIDLVCQAAEQLLKFGIQLVILGQGEQKYEERLSGIAARAPGLVGLRLTYNEELAHKIYAGADAFLMPSKHEPCGLSQMIALRYGTPPIVREVGGLADTVKDASTGIGNGFTFNIYDASEMFDACLRAKAVFNDKENWQALTKWAMECDNSWAASAKEYKALYEKTLTLW